MINPAEKIIEIIDGSNYLSCEDHEDIVKYLEELEQGWLRCQTLERSEIDSLTFIDDLETEAEETLYQIKKFKRDH